VWSIVRVDGPRDRNGAPSCSLVIGGNFIILYYIIYTAVMRFDSIIDSTAASKDSYS